MVSILVVVTNLKQEALITLLDDVNHTEPFTQDFIGGMIVNKTFLW
jgi:hypothetical protein